MLWLGIGIVFIGVPLYALCVASKQADAVAKRLADTEAALCYLHGDDLKEFHEAYVRVRERMEVRDE